MINDWLVIRTRAGQECAAARNLSDQGIETYNPQTHERRRNGSKIKIVARPLFSRYFFAKFDIDSLFTRVSNTRGVERLVRFGETFARVPDAVIAEIDAWLRDGCPARSSA
jgi:transcriptional antiterminator RfaH